MWFPPSRRPYRRSRLWRTRQMFRELEFHRRRQERLRCSCGSPQDLRPRQQRHGRCCQLDHLQSGTRASSRAAWRRGESLPRQPHQRGLPRVRARREHLPIWFALCRRRRVRPRQRSARHTSTPCSSQLEGPLVDRSRTRLTTVLPLLQVRQSRTRRLQQAKQQRKLQVVQLAPHPSFIRRQASRRRVQEQPQPRPGVQCRSHTGQSRRHRLSK